MAPPSWTSLINSSRYIPQRDASRRDDVNEVPPACNSHVRFRAFPLAVVAQTRRARGARFTVTLVSVRLPKTGGKIEGKSGRVSCGRSRGAAGKNSAIQVRVCAWRTRGVCVATAQRSASVECSGRGSVLNIVAIVDS